MAGRIRDADIATVRDRVNVVEVVGSVVTLRNAGGGRLKGLCPFHDEKSPSFTVNPALGFYHCFGCGESGDVISFVRQTQQLSFVEAVEVLARQAGVELTYEQGSSTAGSTAGRRARLLSVMTAAQDWFVAQLATPEAAPARAFLAERGFDAAAAERFGCGYAPNGWTTLLDELTGRPAGQSFRREELQAVGLVKPSARGSLIDTFRGRLLWPIRDTKGDVVGFNARKLREDDPGPKYLNSPDTELFTKSKILLGLDLAKKEIARRRQAVIVEGVTDVMACHLAGVPTAVATCGTAFGADHIKALRLVLMDSDSFQGEVVFTFDGDEAGRKAALKAFRDDQRFVTQTFVAIEPTGADPCDLRLHKGDLAVRDLVASRIPLVEFVVRSKLAEHDLETAEGRVRALHDAAPLVAEIKDRALRPEYVRRLGGWLGMEERVVAEQVAAHVPQQAPPGRSGTERRPAAPEQRVAPRAAVDPSVDPAVRSRERQVLTLAVQRPQLAGPAFDVTESSWFVVPVHRAVREVIAEAGGCAAAPGGQEWVARLLAAAEAQEAVEQVRAAVTAELSALTVESLPYDAEPDDRYVADLVASLELFAVERRVRELSSRVQRLNPVEHPDAYNRAVGELFALEGTRRRLRERGMEGL
ncbi:MAG: primase [Mycobacterium sp.]|nr:primase [Mycobacterium sp.]